MNVEIINVGTELLLGEIVNTNATYLQKKKYKDTSKLMKILKS